MSRVLDPAAAGRPSELIPCSLYSGHYHYGIGALANSLYRQGFRGRMCIGFGGELPGWAAGGRRDGSHTIIEPADGLQLRFIPWPTEQNMTFEKPRFMLHVLDEVEVGARGAVFIDADVVVHGAWQFFEDWLSHGVGLVLDACYPTVPSGHPWRAGWRALAQEAGYASSRDLEFYVNGGFVGVKRELRELLECWQVLIEHFLHRQRGPVLAMKGNTRQSAFGADDQDLLNAAMMATSVPLSIIGQEGMDFTPAGYAMSHAVGKVKPWRKRFVAEALAGRPPSAADKNYWLNAAHPIALFSRGEIARARFRIKVASAIGRVYAQS